MPAAKRPRVYPAKVGSIPKCIVLFRGCRPKVGRKITFRYHDEGHHGDMWKQGWVREIREEDGHLWIDL